MAPDATQEPLSTPVHRSPSPRWWRRTEAEVVRDQLTALAAWTSALKSHAAVQGPVARTRESKVDLRRREDVLLREHQAVLESTARQLSQTGQGSGSPLRAVVAHRDDWYTDRLAQALGDCGVRVVARTPNGADAVGMTVGEQPDLLVVEELLQMLPGVEVLRQALELAPKTLAVAQASSRESTAVLVAAGAVVVCPRSAAPGELAAEICGLMTSCSEPEA